MPSCLACTARWSRTATRIPRAICCRGCARSSGRTYSIAAELDPHSHLTAKRLAAADFFVYFKEFPHTDFVDRAEDLWRIAVDTLEGRVKPVMSVFDCRMIDVYPTSRDPMRSFVDKLMRMEAEDADILSMSVVHGFMAGDVPEMGTKMLVVTNDRKEKGDVLARELGLELFSKRGTFIMPQIDEKQAVSEALAAAGMAGGDRRCLGQSRRRDRRRRDGHSRGASGKRRDGDGDRHDLGPDGGADLHGGRRGGEDPAAVRREIRA